MKRLAFFIACLFLACRLEAYVKSATLEYSVDDAVTFYLNGKPLLVKSEPHPFDYAVLSTSDGSLPLQFFNQNGENILAADNLNTEGGVILMSYRLTVNQSGGDPVKVWSVEDNTRFVHLEPRQAEPPRWMMPDFDDSLWGRAVATRPEDEFVARASLFDAAFEGPLGAAGRVPFLAHQKSALSAGGERNLFRSHFQFPNKLDKASLKINPAQAKAGENVAIRVMPGRDVADFGDFGLFAMLPQGLSPLQVPQGAAYDASRRMLSWSFRKESLSVRLLTLNAETVLSAPGWAKESKVLGGFKPGKPVLQLNIPDADYFDGALMAVGRPAWFKLGAPGIKDGPGAPRILGVIFHSQINVGGYNSTRRHEVDEVRFNYSVDGSQQGALKEAVDVARTSNLHYWIDGYHDASEDRAWTWGDLERLRVSFEVQPQGHGDKNRLASSYAVVRYFQPADTAPVFYARVDERNCADLPLRAGAWRQGAQSLGSDPAPFKANPQLCAPSPTPVPTAAPVIAVRPQPTSTPEAGLSLEGQAPLGLNCLDSAPKPFKRGGVFLYFCLKNPGHIRLTIYDAAGGKRLRSMDGGDYRAGGRQELYFNGFDDGGRALRQGHYIAELEATVGSRREIRQQDIEKGPN